MTKRKEVMITLVKEEAKNLRRLLTQAEKDKLNFQNLDPDNRTRCIYGQISDSCYSERATELIKNSCKRVYHRGKDDITDAKINGSPLAKARWNFWSPIECFIIQDDNKNLINNNNKNLLNYIKGITNRLNLV